MSKNLAKTIRNFSFQEDLWQKGSRIILGVSGGPDSVCLLAILAVLAPKYDLKLMIAHVNYGLRGKDSERDEKFVRELAEKYGLKIEVLKFPKTKLWKNLKLSFGKLPSENALRDIRYAFFEKIRKENNFDLIAVAHNQDDQAETVLMRMLRGSGLKGLSGMSARNGKIIRPLLKTSRREILGYLRNNSLAFRTDKTNTQPIFLRNKIRHQLIPYIEKKFNPNFRQTLAESASSFGDDAKYLDKLACKYHLKNSVSSAKKLLALDPALQRRVLLLAVLEKKRTLKNIGLSHIQEMLRAVKSAKNKNQIVKFQGLKLIRKGDKVTLS